MREQIEIDSELTPKDQSFLVSELRSHFRDGGRAEEIIDLLQRLKRRDELLAKVSRDIDDLQGDINRAQRGSPSNNERESLREPASPPPVASSGLSREDSKDQVREPVSEVETGRELKLDSIYDECNRIMGRVRDMGEVWVFEFDPRNRFVISSNGSAVMAKA